MPQGCRCLSAAGPGVLLVTEESAVPILTGKKPASNPVLTAGSPVTENYRFRSAAGSPECGAGYRETTVPMLTDKKPASNPVLTTGSPVTEVYRL